MRDHFVLEIEDNSITLLANVVLGGVQYTVEDLEVVAATVVPCIVQAGMQLMNYLRLPQHVEVRTKVLFNFTGQI